MRHTKKTVKLRKPWHPSRTGVILFVLIFVYLVASILYNFTRKNISIYRVINDTRSEIINEKGIIIRDEMVYSSEHSGYINYYTNSLSLTGKSDIIYTVDSTGSIYSNLTNEDMTEYDNEINLKTIFHQYFTSNNEFESIYKLKAELTESALLKSSRSVLTNMKNVLENYGNNSYFHINYAKDSGIVVFGTDGFEGLKPEDVDTSVLEQDEEGILKLPPENSTKIEAGTPVYKLIKNEEWQVVISVSEEQATKLSEKNLVEVILGGSSFKAKAQVELFKKEDRNFAVLKLFNYMVNFADKRFINVYLSLDTVSGLKIAKSAIVEKKFYLIPSDFIVPKDDKFLQKGINLLTFDSKGNPTFKFIEVMVYNEEEGYSYIDYEGEYSAGDRISKIRSKDINIKDEVDYLTTISKVNTLSGVYNVNKGYPEFKRIEILSDIDSDYCLVSDSSKFGLSDYDNIVLNANVLEGTKDD